MNGMQKIVLSRSGAAIATTVFVVGGFAGGYMFSTYGAVGLAAAASSGEPAGVDFTPVWRAWNIIDTKFVPAAVSTSTPLATSTETLNKQKVYGMVSGLADSLGDPYTFFLPPVENKEFASDMKGSFEGVGMEIEVKDQVLTVVSPLKNSPALSAGIKSGDQILKINGESTTGLDTGAAVNKIRGPKGSTVVLTIMREGWEKPREISVVRDVITVPILTTTPRPDHIFVIQLSTFTENSPSLFRAALREFIASGDKKLILDLRGNPGGYLDAAVDIGSWYLPQGAVVVTEDYAGHRKNVVHRSRGYNIFSKKLQMVILVDKGSASASEILAAALRHYGIAKTVGTNTFGKGSVQELVDITPDTSLKVTVARWLAPDGKQIPHEGVAPDYSVEISDDDKRAGRDTQLEKAIQLLGGTAATSSKAER